MNDLPRVLVVDDNATNRKLLIHLCTAWRMRHRAADGALNALDELRVAARTGRPFDLVILDHHLPDINGLGLASMVLADPTIPKPTFVLLTSRGERLQKAQMDAHGLAGCELKPLHPEKLRITLSRIMAQSLSPFPRPATAPPMPAASTVTPTLL